MNVITLSSFSCNLNDWLLYCHHEGAIKEVLPWGFTQQRQEKDGLEGVWIYKSTINEGEDNEYIFAHAFLACEWNLMSWAENIEDCHADNVVWIEDALGFHFPMTKTDHLGKRSDAIWHDYVTPKSPQTGAHLARTCYLISIQEFVQGKMHLHQNVGDWGWQQV